MMLAYFDDGSVILSPHARPCLRRQGGFVGEKTLAISNVERIKRNLCGEKTLEMSKDQGSSNQ